MGKIRSVLFVCTGNSCRSVMAEGLLKKRLAELGKSGITVRSAGVRAFNGYSPMNETVEVMKAEGVDLSGFKSTAVTDELIRETDLILVMSAEHKREIVKKVPEAETKIFLLSEYGRNDKNGRPVNQDIPDPVGLPVFAYKACLSMINEEIERVAKLL